MALKSSVMFVAFFVVGCLAAVALQVYFFSPISPQVLHLPSPSVINALFPPNSRLQEVTKIGEGLLKDPEDVCMDKNGILYTASRDGWIKRMHKDGSMEDWKKRNSSTLLGMTITAAGDLVICDTQEGLLRVNDDGVTILASEFNGSKLRFADDVVEGNDGSLYFSVASTKFGLHEWCLDMLEAKPHGQLLKYNPQTKETSLLLDNLSFANGVALSTDQDYLIICETWKFRCLKYWLQGDHRGTTEIFIENLPGGPDNINLAPDGSFWLALVPIMNGGVIDIMHSSKIVKHFLATFPRIVKVWQAMYKKATVIKVSADGKVVTRYDDPNGKVMSFVTSAVEHDGNLYFGSLDANFIGKLPLNS